MEDRLVDDDHLSAEQRSLLPKAGFFVPDSVRREERRREYEDRVSGRDVVALVDGDADGLGAAVLLRHAHDDVGYVGTSPNRLEDSLALVEEHLEDGADVYVVDLCPDDVDDLAALDGIAERAETVTWLDHHRWPEEVAEHVEAHGVELVVGESDEECSADVTLRVLQERGHDFPPHLVELVEVTRDHDLWIRDDPRSDDLADLSVYLDADDYVEAVSRGPEPTEEYREYLDERRREKRRMIDLAVERASRTEVGDVDVAHTYGRCSQNEVAETLRGEGADAVVVVKPEGGTSLRGSDGFERCHEVARLLDGGGHPRAAGCKPPVFDTMLDYAEHWTTEGRRARDAVLEAFADVVDG
ncbi:MAG: DHH family phosphoesterase [Halobacteriales archaeon]